MPHMLREGFVWAKHTLTGAKEYVPAHWVGSSWFPQYKPLKSSEPKPSETAAARPASPGKKKNTPDTADDSAATTQKE